MFNKFKQCGNVEVAGLVAVVFWLLLIGGYVANIVKLCFAISGEVTTMFIMRIVGVFAAPLGVILGFF